MISIQVKHILIALAFIIFLTLLISGVLYKLSSESKTKDQPVPPKPVIEEVNPPEKIVEELKREESKEDDLVKVKDWTVVKRFKTEKNCYEVLILKVNWQNEFITSIHPIGCSGVN